MGVRVVHGLESDSIDYHVLTNAINVIKGVPGMVCEIGTRRGGSLVYMVESLIANKDFGRNIVCIDPYGNIDYKTGELEPDRPLKLDYTNDMRNEALPAIYDYLQGKPVNVVFQCLEDTEFFNRFGDGVPFYNDYKTIENRYACVFFDGPHTLAALETEVDFFQPRSSTGSVWIFDDIELYPHNELEQLLFKNGWEMLEKTQRKASYIKKI